MAVLQVVRVSNRRETMSHTLKPLCLLVCTRLLVIDYVYTRSRGTSTNFIYAFEIMRYWRSAVFS